MNNIKQKHKNGATYKRFDELEIGDIFLSNGPELWMKISRQDIAGWFYEPENKWYYYVNSVCLNDGILGITDDGDECVVVKELEYDL